LTILQKSIVEHNMIAASRIYCNIRLKELQMVLRLDNARLAEQVACRMIAEGRLRGSIDETLGIVTFLGSGDDIADGAGAGTEASIAQICQQVSDGATAAEKLLSRQ
jgi:COP9 signalosome complex subunit 4